ncbi:cation:proton antiporter [Wenxinia marina]|uniref:Transporter, CPA2 family n=1 Tax=Wenxinia marina DSM 24838 TaxID=1123501 RepID=A0A0D0QJP2_9RHOB|nr:cation:proton antiporter [Wenxinia marina]KIQ71208.1 transporter, CPA2 family [Wenxinia marina DSM 24838]GGL81621.1 hypothetical protein GCM10011392_40300 [Wenxinia marina]
MNLDIVLIALGVVFLAGLALDALGRRMHVPRVSLLILLGVVVGPPVLDLLPLDIASANDAYAPIALSMVAFLLGGTLNTAALRERGRQILTLSVTVVLATAAFVGGGLLLAGAPLVVALALAGIATATDPAATRDVVRESGATTPFSANILGIVAIDDVWGVLAFSLILAALDMMTGAGMGDSIAVGLRDVGGGVLLGVVLGVPAAALTGRLRPGEPTLIEAVGVVLLTVGLALWLEVSYLIAGMTCGAVVANLARHHEQPFHEIQQIEWPFMLLFFVLAGGSLDMSYLPQAGWLVVLYIGLRIAGRLVGGWLGDLLTRQPGHDGLWTGLGLLPQAGVAVGMALVAAERFPELGEPILAVTITATVAFEVVGPLLTGLAVRRAGDGRR